MKKGLQMSFAWIFGIIVGAFILFMAVFLAGKIIRVGETEISAKTGKEIGALLNPLETELETGRTTTLEFPVDTKIYNKCGNNGFFGEQRIEISQKSFGKWTETDIDATFYNKYIFSDDISEGKKFYILSKPFEFPFKIANALYITSSLKKYCFIDAPEEIEEEIKYLKQENLLTDNCENVDSIKICFEFDSDCDVYVNYNSGYVEKENKRVYFETDTLMYGAIFSDKNIYECQLKRLMKRAGNLALIYKDKSVLVAQTGCYSNLNHDLLVLNSLANNFESSSDVRSMSSFVEDIKNKNDLAMCKLW